MMKEQVVETALQNRDKVYDEMTHEKIHEDIKTNILSYIGILSNLSEYEDSRIDEMYALSKILKNLSYVVNEKEKDTPDWSTKYPSVYDAYRTLMKNFCNFMSVKCYGGDASEELKRVFSSHAFLVSIILRMNGVTDKEKAVIASSVKSV